MVQQQGEFKNSGYDNSIEVQVVARLVADPESNLVNNSKVAKSKIAINHPGTTEKTDYWFVEVWGNEGQDSLHNFFVNNLSKGKKVFITGVPELRQTVKDGVYSYYPTIKARKVIALDPLDKATQQGQPQGGYQPQAQQGGYQPAPQQGGYQPQQGQYQPPTQQQGQPQYAQQPQQAAQPQYAQQPQQGYQPQPQQGYQPPAQQQAPGYPQQQMAGAPAGFPPNMPNAGAPMGAPMGAPVHS